MEPKRAPLFVLGYPRSGTTLLAEILNRHPDVALANESAIVFALYRQGLDVCSRLSGTEAAAFVDRAVELRPFRAHVARLDPGVLESLRAVAGEIGFPELYARLLPRPAGARVWGEKSLNAIFHLRELLAAFPESGAVVLVRDPRAVALSKAIKRRARDEGFRPTTSYSARDLEFRSTWGLFAVQALRWSAWDAKARALLADPVVAERVLCARYEDLVADPQSVVARICAWSGIAFAPAMLAPSEPRTVHTARYAHEKVGGPIDPSRARAFEELSPRLLAVVERLAAAGLAAHGYAPIARLDPLARAEVELRLALRRRRLRADQSHWVAERFASPE